ncbi:hypothetical protein D3C72_2264490 [compost metagenome]
MVLGWGFAKALGHPGQVNDTDSGPGYACLERSVFYFQPQRANRYEAQQGDDEEVQDVLGRLHAAIAEAVAADHR